MSDQEGGPAGSVRPMADPTGVPGLDAVLGGGLPRRALAIIVGPPGSGKTTLAGQIAFAAARAGRRALILTAFSEPGDKLVDHLRPFAFFDEALVGDAVRIVSMRQFLPRGLDAAGAELREVARAARAELVVLDGFCGALRAAPDPDAAHAFLADLGAALGARGVTTLITSEGRPRDPATFPEATAADVLIGLHYDLAGVRARRALEAVKARGAAPLLGLHPLVIGPAGAAVYPRLESRLAPPAEDEAEPGRAAFDLPELDAMLGGGLPARTLTLALGSPGTGKTLLGLHFALAGVEAGEPALWFSLREGRAALLRAADAFGLGPRLRAALGGGGLALTHLEPVELDPDVAADALLAGLDAGGARRLVLDGLAELEAAVGERAAPRMRGYLTALAAALRARGVTALLLKEAGRLVAPALEAEADLGSVVADNVLLLERLVEGGRLRRVLSAPKVRFTAHDERVRAFEIVPPGGIRVRAAGGGEGAA